jgi:hypothetical protein
MKELTILLSPHRIDFTPKLVEVCRREILSIAVDWTDNVKDGVRFWSKVEVGSFIECYPNEKTDYGVLPELEVGSRRSRSYENERRVEFQETAFDLNRSQDIYARFSIAATTVQGETWTFDPVIIIKPWPGDDVAAV